MADFDPGRITNVAATKVFKPLVVERLMSVREALTKKYLKEDSEVFVVRIGATTPIAFPKRAMGFHHLAAGQVAGQQFLLSFCNVCNSGMVFNPVVEGKLLKFAIAGVYNGMLLMKDTETQSYWDHITGECLHGVFQGQQLEILQPHQVSTLRELLTDFPESQFPQPKLNCFQRLLSIFLAGRTTPRGKGMLPPGFKASMRTPDSRLPELEMGVGVWTAKKQAKFYPRTQLIKKGKVIVETFHQQEMIVFIAPDTQIPTAIYVTGSNSPELKEDRLLLGNGAYVRKGNLYSSAGQELPLRQPHQMFSRWYGFVATFPECEVMH